MKQTTLHSNLLGCLLNKGVIVGAKNERLVVHGKRPRKYT